MPEEKSQMPEVANDAVARLGGQGGSVQKCGGETKSLSNGLQWTGWGFAMVRGAKLPPLAANGVHSLERDDHGFAHIAG